MKRSFGVVAFAVLIGCEGCGSKQLAAVSGPVANYDVYVAGYETSSSGVRVATVWKNGRGTPLTDGVSNAYASSVAVSNGVTYVAGVENNGKNDVVTVWVDGVPQELTDGALQGVVSEIVVAGSDVYVVGGEYGFTKANQYVDTGGYWKNGSFVPIIAADSYGQNGGSVAALLATESTVYIVGVRDRVTSTGPSTAVANPVPTIWVNGMGQALSDGLHFANATSISVFGSDVYVGGSICADEMPNCQEAAFWKNGVLHSSALNTPSIVNGVVADVAGITLAVNEATNNGTRAEYLSNDATTKLAEGENTSANAITKSGGHTFVVGTESGGACYWIDGQLHTVTSGALGSAGLGLAVTPQM